MKSHRHSLIFSPLLFFSMKYTFKLLLFVCTLSAVGALHAQTLTLSPYSRYGLGDVFSFSSARTAGMGGIGIGSTAFFTPNRLNPASYSDFLFGNKIKRFDARRSTFDVSGFGVYSNQATKLGTADQATAGFRDLTYLFPSNKNVAFVAGFTPYSTVGYEITDTSRLYIPGDTLFTQVLYSGRGGLNQAYLGTATTFFKNKLRVGANAYVNFGNIQYEWVSGVFLANSNFVKVNQNTRMSGVGTLIGLQYQDTLKRDSTKNPILFRIGAISDLNLGIKSTRQTDYRSFSDTGGITDTLYKEQSQQLKLPQKYGFGFEFSRPYTWYIGADVLYQDWKNFQHFNEQSDLRQDLQIGLGGEWTPDLIGEKYFQRMSYRTGAFYHKTYLNYNSRSVDDFGWTLGLGLPMTRNKQFTGDFIGRFNLSVEVGKRGDLAYHPMREFYTRVRFGITISERWFVKRVVD